MGWLNARPDGSGDTRAELLEYSLPDIPAAEAMPDHWRGLGYARSLETGGLGAFEWQEIDAYVRLTGNRLTPVEAHCLMDMSRAYVAGISDTNPLSIEPKERANG